MELVGLTSLQEAAEACGLDKAALWRYFNFDVRPSIERLPNLCRGLQVSLDELLVALNVHIPYLWVIARLISDRHKNTQTKVCK
jgi:transcriptional regulator with XRE-family HTH domain